MSWVDNWKNVLHLKDLDSSEKAVLGCLASHGGDGGDEAYPSEATIGFETSLSQSTVRRALSRIEAKGYIWRTRRDSHRSDRFGHYEYKLNVELILERAMDGEEAFRLEVRENREREVKRVTAYRNHRRTEERECEPEAPMTVTVPVLYEQSERKLRADCSDGTVTVPVNYEQIDRLNPRQTPVETPVEIPFEMPATNGASRVLGAAQPLATSSPVADDDLADRFRALPPDVRARTEFLFARRRLALTSDPVKEFEPGVGPFCPQSAIPF